MKFYKADLHTHTVLSPCGDLDMSPEKIIEEAKRKGIDILGITDHNTTRQCKALAQAAREEDVFLLCGSEVNTREEVHCLAFFEQTEQLAEFDSFLYDHLENIQNHPDKFGYQVVVDKKGMILEEIDKLLISATDLAIDEVEKKVHELDGLFIPAHVDRLRNGLMGQLGFIPPGLNFDALELSKHTSRSQFVSEHPEYSDFTYIQSSDAHFLKDVGAVHTLFYINKPSFDEVRKALHNEEGRKTVLKTYNKY
jgi:PHP family Zn ribbon phosphoesterase